jgi:hypothetical protein
VPEIIDDSTFKVSPFELAQISPFELPPTTAVFFIDWTMLSNKVHRLTRPTGPTGSRAQFAKFGLPMKMSVLREGRERHGSYL